MQTGFPRPGAASRYKFAQLSIYTKKVSAVLCFQTVQDFPGLGPRGMRGAKKQSPKNNITEVASLVWCVVAQAVQDFLGQGPHAGTHPSIFGAQQRLKICRCFLVGRLCRISSGWGRGGCAGRTLIRPRASSNPTQTASSTSTGAVPRFDHFFLPVLLKELVKARASSSRIRLRVQL